MSQPIPKKVKQNNPDFGMKTFNTLLVDGSNILELSSLGDRTISSNGKQIGGIFQFLLQIKLLLAKANFLDIPVYVDALCCAGVTPKSHNEALNTMKMCQIIVL